MMAGALAAGRLRPSIRALRRLAPKSVARARRARKHWSGLSVLAASRGAGFAAHDRERRVVGQRGYKGRRGRFVAGIKRSPYYVVLPVPCPHGDDVLEL